MVASSVEQQCEMVSDMGVARKLWDLEYDLSLNQRRFCGHNRISQTAGPCSQAPDKGKCTYKWGTTRLVLVHGYCSPIIVECLDFLKVPKEHCQIRLDTVTSNNGIVIGCCVGNENCQRDSSTVFKFISRRLQAACNK